MPALQVENLCVRYGNVIGTNGIDFQLPVGGVLALIGSNGAGKSSTLRAIAGLVKPAEGRILAFGEDIAGWGAERVVTKGVTLSPEGRKVFSGLTVEENLRVGGYIKPRASINSRIEEMYGYFPRLRERRKQRAESMSGGEQQMLAIARALMPKPRILLLDEPSLGLAPIIVDAIGDLIHDIGKKEKLSVILAEQNANWSLSISSDAVVIELGKVTLAGNAKDVAADPRVRQAFMGA